VAFQPTRFIPPTGCPAEPCALTAHFHPYPDESGRLFSATLAVFRRMPEPHSLNGVVRCVVRTFLIPDLRRDRDRVFAMFIFIDCWRLSFEPWLSCYRMR